MKNVYATPVISKPINIQRLIHVLKSWLSESWLSESWLSESWLSENIDIQKSEKQSFS